MSCWRQPRPEGRILCTIWIENYKYKKLLQFIFWKNITQGYKYLLLVPTRTKLFATKFLWKIKMSEHFFFHEQHKFQNFTLTIANCSGWPKKEIFHWAGCRKNLYKQTRIITFGTNTTLYYENISCYTNMVIFWRTTFLTKSLLDLVNFL